MEAQRPQSMKSTPRKYGNQGVQDMSQALRGLAIISDTCVDPKMIKKIFALQPLPSSISASDRLTYRFSTGNTSVIIVKITDMAIWEPPPQIWNNDMNHTVRRGMNALYHAVRHQHGINLRSSHLPIILTVTSSKLKPIKLNISTLFRPA
jgi:hypothetical protein